jgi:hypothetical protein
MIGEHQPARTRGGAARVLTGQAPLIAVMPVSVLT